MAIGDEVGKKTLEQALEEAPRLLGERDVKTLFDGLRRGIADDVDAVLSRHLGEAPLPISAAALLKQADRLIEQRLHDARMKVQDIVRSDIDYAITNLRVASESLVKDSVGRMEHAIANIRLDVRQDTTDLSRDVRASLLTVGLVVGGAVGLANIVGMAFAVWVMKGF